MRIGEVAEHLGVETHVLRHWEDVGVIQPERTAAGYRNYDNEMLARLQIVVACKGAGLSLEEIRVVLHSREAGRRAAIRRRRQIVDSDIKKLRNTRRFLDHVIDCRHSLVTRCPACSEFAETSHRNSGGPSFSVGHLAH